MVNDMSLKDRLVADMTQAMKAKDANKLSTLRMAKSALMNEENKRGVGTVLTDDEVSKVLLSLVKQRKDSIEQFTAGGRQDLVDKERAELSVLEGYLPARLDAAAIAAEVAALIADTGATGPGDMGKAMAAAKARFAGRADMGLVSAAVKAALSPR